MIAALALFAASVAYVFVMGFQSRNVNSGNYGWAAVTSFSAGLTQTYVLATVITATDLPHTLIYCCGGAAGIVMAMWVHQRFLSKPIPQGPPGPPGPMGLQGPPGACLCKE